MECRRVIEHLRADVRIHLLRQYLSAFNVVGIIDPNRLDVEWMVLRQLGLLLIALPLLDKLPRLDDQLLLALDEQYFWEDLDVQDIVVVHKVLLVLDLILEREAQLVQGHCLLPLEVVHFVILLAENLLLVLITVPLVVTLLEKDLIFNVLPLDFIIVDCQFQKVEVTLRELEAVLQVDVAWAHVLVLKHLQLLLEADHRIDM